MVNLIKSNYKRPLLFIFSAVVLGVCLIYLFSTFQWVEISELLFNTNYVVSQLVLMVLTIPLYWVVRTWRWLFMLRRSGFECKFSELYMVTAIALSVAQFAPFQSGEVMKMELMKKRGGLGRSQGYSSFLVERFADLFIVSVTAIVAILVLSELTFERNTIYIFMAMALICAVGFLFLLRFLRNNPKVAEFSENILLFVKSPGLIIPILLLTCLSWLVVAAGWYFALSSLKISTGYLPIILLVALVTVINLSSFIPGSVGVSEVSIAIILISLKVEPASAQAGALIIRGYGVLISLIGGMHYLLYHLFLRFNRN